MVELLVEDAVMYAMGDTQVRRATGARLEVGPVPIGAVLPLLLREYGLDGTPPNRTTAREVAVAALEFGRRSLCELGELCEIG